MSASSAFHPLIWQQHCCLGRAAQESPQFTNPSTKVRPATTATSLVDGIEDHRKLAREGVRVGCCVQHVYEAASGLKPLTQHLNDQCGHALISKARLRLLPNWKITVRECRSFCSACSKYTYEYTLCQTPVAEITRSHGQLFPDGGVLSRLMCFASHDLFMGAFSTACGFLSITVKWGLRALSGRLRQPPVSAILAGLEQRFDFIVIPQERDKQVRWSVLEDEA